MSQNAPNSFAVPHQSFRCPSWNVPTWGKVWGKWQCCLGISPIPASAMNLVLSHNNGDSVLFPNRPIIVAPNDRFHPDATLRLRSLVLFQGKDTNDEGASWLLKTVYWWLERWRPLNYKDINFKETSAINKIKQIIRIVITCINKLKFKKRK